MRDEVLPLLLDTDIGTNIDDALALAYLLRHPQCALQGITTVHGDTQARAQLASAICRALGRGDVPIHRGAARPLVHEPTRWDAPQRCILDRWDHEAHFEPDTAVGFLREKIRAQPGHVTLLCIGPLTNIALLFQRDPQVALMLKELVCMGGVYFGSPADYGPVEWNIAADSEAATRVLAADVPAFHLVGLDVTMRCRLDTAACRSRLEAAGLHIITDLVDVWSQQRREVVFHDPLAAAVVFESDLCRFREGRVNVELISGELAGRTRLATSDRPGPHRVACDVQSEQFFEHYWQIVGRA